MLFHLLQTTTKLYSQWIALNCLPACIVCHSKYNKMDMPLSRGPLLFFKKAFGRNSDDNFGCSKPNIDTWVSNEYIRHIV
jgi:hypothetical protein